MITINQHFKFIVQLPDILFVKHCEKEYGLNRGVYNTIDQWFFEKNSELTVEMRRKLIILFIEYFKSDFVDNQEKFVVGKGNLVNYLNNFWSLYLEKELKKELA